VELSGLIFVALALVWAVVLIPKALKHHDEVAETRSVDGVSDAMRVLARREPVNPREARLVVRPEPDTPPGRSSSSPQRPAPRAQLNARRRAAAAAARRRRRVLVLLLVTSAGIGAAAYLGYLLPWAPAVPAAVVLAFLVVARFTVRREQARWDALVASREAEREPAAEMVEPAPDVVEPASGVVEPASGVVEPASGVVEPVEPTRNEQGLHVVSGLDDTSTFPVGILELEPTTDAGALWDPLPVTLPTYVSKPRATRSVRTIDLSAPGVASSGRDAAASALVAEAATAGPDEPGQQAVGS
jgi:hypothetical protein